MPTVNLQNNVRFDGGSTNYSAAFRNAITICDNFQDKCQKFVFYFMSDGEPDYYPSDEIKTLKSKPYFSKIQFYSCGFGHSSFGQLNRLTAEFPGGEMKNAPTLAELKESMLYILRADNSGPMKQKRKANAALKPLWNRDRLEVDDYFSSVSYLKVQKIEGEAVTVTNSLGGSWKMSKELLVKNAWSADIFAEEVKTTMTELAVILTACKETIFKVSFKKKVTQADIEQKLGEINFNDQKNLKLI